MDEPDVGPQRGERVQVKATARRIDTGHDCELQLCGLADGSWSLRVPDGPVVVLDYARALYVARSTLGLDRTGSIRWAASSRDRSSPRTPWTSPSTRGSRCEPSAVRS